MSELPTIVVREVSDFIPESPDDPDKLRTSSSRGMSFVSHSFSIYLDFFQNMTDKQVASNRPFFHYQHMQPKFTVSFKAFFFQRQSHTKIFVNWFVSIKKRRGKDWNQPANLPGHRNMSHFSNEALYGSSFLNQTKYHEDKHWIFKWNYHLSLFSFLFN